MPTLHSGEVLVCFTTPSNLQSSQLKLKKRFCVLLSSGELHIFQSKKAHTKGEESTWKTLIYNAKLIPIAPSEPEENLPTNTISSLNGKFGFQLVCPKQGDKQPQVQFWLNTASSRLRWIQAISLARNQDPRSTFSRETNSTLQIPQKKQKTMFEIYAIEVSGDILLQRHALSRLPLHHIDIHNSNLFVACKLEQGRNVFFTNMKRIQSFMHWTCSLHVEKETSSLDRSGADTCQVNCKVIAYAPLKELDNCYGIEDIESKQSSCFNEYEVVNIKDVTYMSVTLGSATVNAKKLCSDTHVYSIERSGINSENQGEKRLSAWIPLKQYINADTIDLVQGCGRTQEEQTVPKSYGCIRFALRDNMSSNSYSIHSNWHLDDESFINPISSTSVETTESYTVSESIIENAIASSSWVQPDKLTTIDMCLQFDDSKVQTRSDARQNQSYSLETQGTQIKIKLCIKSSTSAAKLAQNIANDIVLSPELHVQVLTEITNAVDEACALDFQELKERLLLTHKEYLRMKQERDQLIDIISSPNENNDSHLQTIISYLRSLHVGDRSKGESDGFKSSFKYNPSSPNLGGGDAGGGRVHASKKYKGFDITGAGDSACGNIKAERQKILCNMQSDQKRASNLSRQTSQDQEAILEHAAIPGSIDVETVSSQFRNRVNAFRWHFPGKMRASLVHLRMELNQLKAQTCREICAAKQDLQSKQESLLHLIKSLSEKSPLAHNPTTVPATTFIDKKSACVIQVAALRNYLTETREQVIHHLSAFAKTLSVEFTRNLQRAISIDRRLQAIESMTSVRKFNQEKIQDQENNFDGVQNKAPTMIVKEKIILPATKGSMCYKDKSKKFSGRPVALSLKSIVSRSPKTTPSLQGFCQHYLKKRAKSGQSMHPVEHPGRPQWCNALSSHIKPPPVLPPPPALAGVVVKRTLSSSPPRGKRNSNSKLGRKSEQKTRSYSEELATTQDNTNHLNQFSNGININSNTERMFQHPRNHSGLADKKQTSSTKSESNEKCRNRNQSLRTDKDYFTLSDSIPPFLLPKELREPDAGDGMALYSWSASSISERSHQFSSNDQNVGSISLALNVLGSASNLDRTNELAASPCESPRESSLQQQHSAKEIYDALLSIDGKQ